jgi:hypothetical protein
MNLKKKKCHVCGCENSESDFFCQNCGIDISLVGIAHPASPTETSRPAVESPASSQRVCPKCGQSNDAVFMLCRHCGFDFSASPAVNATHLSLVIGSEVFECKDGDVLGRDGTVARPFFSAIGTVSRKHVSLVNRNGAWFVAVCPGVQNITRLDDNELKSGTEQPLTGEHVLKLSTQCEVRLRVGS